jgi:hypothetical protein
LAGPFHCAEHDRQAKEWVGGRFEQTDVFGCDLSKARKKVPSMERSGVPNVFSMETSRLVLKRTARANKMNGLRFCCRTSSSFQPNSESTAFNNFWSGFRRRDLIPLCVTILSPWMVGGRVVFSD